LYEYFIFLSIGISEKVAEHGAIVRIGRQKCF